MTKTAVVILNWNGKDYLEKFLPSVTMFSNDENTKVIVADNASSDDSIAFIKEKYPQVEIIKNDKNHGFAGGYNKALERVEAEYFVLLNSDVEVTKNWISPIIDLMDSNKKIAACQPKIKAYYNKTLFEHAGAAGGYIDKFGYPFCRGRILDKLEVDNGQYDQAKQVFWATGACLFVRSDVYKQSGGLDEDFFAHMEEIDMCWRINNLGYEIYCEPKSVVYHVGGGTLNKSNPMKTYLNFRNNLYMLYKNLPNDKLKSIMFKRKILDGIAGLKFLLSFDFKHFTSVLKAHKSYYAELKKLKSKRKNISRENNETTYSLIHNKSIVWQYFAKKIDRFSEL